METKICSRCKKEQLTINFNKDKTKIDGFYTLCKSCRLNYRKTHKKQIKEQLINYRKLHPHIDIKLTIICPICQIEFIGNNKIKYCSKKCSKQANKINNNNNMKKYRNRDKKLCPFCKKTMIYFKSKSCLCCSLKSLERREAISKSKQGKKRKPFSIQWRRNLGNSHRGKLAWNYKGRTLLYELIRKNLEYSIWRNKIFKRDNYTCQNCGQTSKGNIECHHKKEFSVILEEFLNHYPNLDPMEDKEFLFEQALLYKPFWDLNNGITLCDDCHDKIEHQSVIYAKGRK